jgi:hypothetical protein
MFAMQEMLYKTENREDLKSEFYEILVLPCVGNGGCGYIFVERHAWWDEKSKQAKHSLTTICPESGLTLEEAEEMFKTRRETRARSGFVHSFMPGSAGQGEDGYRLIEI